MDQGNTFLIPVPDPIPVSSWDGLRLPLLILPAPSPQGWTLLLVSLVQTQLYLPEMWEWHPLNVKNRSCIEILTNLLPTVFINLQRADIPFQWLEYFRLPSRASFPVSGCRGGSTINWTYQLGGCLFKLDYHKEISFESDLIQPLVKPESKVFLVAGVPKSTLEGACQTPALWQNFLDSKQTIFSPTLLFTMMF